MRTSILQVVTPELAAVVDGPRRGGRRAAHRRRRTPDAPEPARRGRTRAAALPPARARVPRGAPALDRRHRRPSRSSTDARRTRPRRPTGASPPTTTARPATLPPSRPRSRRHPRDHGRRPTRRRGRGDRPDPEESQPPVLSLLVSRVQLQQRNYEPAMALSDSILSTVKPGSQESDFALLNLITLHLQAGLARALPVTRGAASRKHHKRSVRLIAEGTALLLRAGLGRQSRRHCRRICS